LRVTQVRLREIQLADLLVGIRERLLRARFGRRREEVERGNCLEVAALLE
jgi:hypothetical protein